MAHSTRLLPLDSKALLDERINSVVAKRGILRVVSRPGMGKTSTARNLAATDANACLFEASRARQSYGGMLNALMKAEQLWVASRSNADKAEVLESHFSRFASRYIICDEAQNLDGEALRYLMTFNDSFSTPIILLGNKELIRKTRGHDAAFDQIDDRITDRMELAGPSAKDIQSFCIEFNVSRDAYSRMIAWGVKTSLREIADLLANAKSFIERGPIEIDQIADAIRDRHGPAAAQSFILSPRAAA